MENTLAQPDEIKEYVRNNWEDCALLHFDKLKQTTAAIIQWPFDKKELKKLQFWFKDEKKRSRMVLGASASTLDKVEQAQKIFVKEEGNILQALATLKTLDARVAFLNDQVKKNFMVMLDLMKAIQLPPYGTFLEELFDICSGLENSHSQVLLFIRICALYSDEQIDVELNLVKCTLGELSTETVDSHAAYGLLKLAYCNEISFDQIPINTLLAFEKQYLLEIQAFIRSLHSKIDFQIAQSLPDTCLIFTQPFFKILQSKGKLLHEGMQPCYLVQFVEMIAYSFETQYLLVKDLIQLFNTGCIAIYGRGYDLQPLLQRVVEEEIAQNGLFFGSLKNQTKLFEQLFYLIKENRIPKLIDETTINELIAFDQSTYLSKRKQYKDTGSLDMEANFTKYCQLLQKENQFWKQIPFPRKDATDMVKHIFNRFNIPNINEIQLTSLALMEEQPKIFQVFGTGTGKTTLALAYMLKLAQMDGQKCLYVNDIAELRSRDFNRVAVVAQEMDIKIVLLDTQDDLQLIKMNQLIFLSSPLFQALTKYEELKPVVQDSILILDEFDLTLFAHNIDQVQFSSFTAPKKVAAFTGSPLDKVHQNLVRHYFKVVPLNYPTFNKINGVSNVCLQQEVFDTRKLQLDRLAEFCYQQRKVTPVLVIIEQEAIKPFEILCKKQKMRLIDFNQMTPNQIVAFLDSTFTQNINGAYSICTLNATQGRGLDVPSCSAIENAGGVTTAIAQLPTSSQEFVQFKGRTSRMGNRGQYCVILWNKVRAPLTGDLFVQYHLETVKNQEITRLNALFQKKQSNDDNQYEQAKKDFGIEQNELEIDDCEVKRIKELEQNQFAMDNKEHQHADIKTSQVEYRNEKIMLKVNGQKIYLNQNDWQAYHEGKKTAKGRAIPNYQKLDQETKQTPADYLSAFLQEKRDYRPNKRDTKHKENDFEDNKNDNQAQITTIGYLPVEAKDNNLLQKRNKRQSVQKESQTSKENIKKRNQKQNDNLILSAIQKMHTTPHTVNV